MIEILWEFVVADEKKEEFERHYGSAGTWARFFRASASYRGTTLLAGEGNRYITCDRWDSQLEYEQFRRSHAAEYSALDRRLEPLIQSERSLGIFELK
ncbi:MAG TPA: hypothetical protein VEG63_12505 [Candidatus Acidoferrales bacterium]|nr:hypothetical protein [Candidatus Acidoferrales bacterium]